MLAASALFYLSLDWQGFLILLVDAAVVWLCALQKKRDWFALGLAGALARLLLM